MSETNMTNYKKNSFRNTAIVAGVVLFILKLIARSISAQIEDPQQVSYYYIYVTVIYLIMAIFLLSLYVRVVEAVRLNKIYGWIGLAFLVIFTFQMYQTYEIIPASIQYSSIFNNGDINLLGDSIHSGYLASEMTRALLSNINLWGIFAIGQFVIYVVGDDFLRSTTNMIDPQVQQSKEEPVEPRYYVQVNDMDIEIKNEILFGSGVECNVFLESDFVSSIHGVIGIEDSEVYVRDLGTTNCTFINGTKLEPEENYKLKAGDVVTFANIDVKIIKK